MLANERIELQLAEASDKQDKAEYKLAEDLSVLQERIASVERSLLHNTHITNIISSDTSELLEIFRSVRGGFKVMGWLGVVAKWVAAMAAAVAGIYALIQSMRGH